MSTNIRTAVIAVVISALMGAGGAVAATQITGANVRNNSLSGADIQNVRGGDIADGTITCRDLTQSLQKLCVPTITNSNPSAVTINAPKGDTGETGARGINGMNGANGTRGATGSKGDTGDPGIAGLDGVSGYEVKTYDYIKGGARPGHDGYGEDYPGAGTGSIATARCSDGKVAVGGGYFLRNGANDDAVYDSENWAFRSPAGTDGTAVIASFPGRMDWATNTVKPDDHTGWVVQVNSASASSHDLTVYVVCVDAS